MKHIAYLAVAAGLFCLPACKKKENNTPTPPKEPICRVTSLQYGPETYTVTYDADKRIASFNSATSSRTYTYGTNVIDIVMRSLPSNTKTGSLTVTLNSAGFATQIVDRDASDVVTGTTTYTYDASNQVTQSTYTPAVGSPSVTNYGWSGGNLTTIVSTPPTTLEYYTDKKLRGADYINLLQFANGYRYINNTNPLKAYTSGSSINNFDYTYDSNGYITKMTISTNTSPTTSEYSYTYQCD